IILDKSGKSLWPGKKANDDEEEKEDDGDDGVGGTRGEDERNKISGPLLVGR
ncbi:hypothetical protein RUM43_009131, partial [Polyplax serrata]